MHHPALPVHTAQNAHGQAHISHGPGPAPVDEEPRGRPGLEEPGCAGVEVYADEVQRRPALLIAFEGQCHIYQPRGQLGGKARFEQAGCQLGGQVAVHGSGASGAHAVTEDHLGRRRAAELLDRIARDGPPGRYPSCPEHGPEGRLFREEQGGHPLAGKHLRRLKGPAAEPAHLPRQCRQLGRRKPGAGQRHRRPGPAQIVQRDGAFQRRGPQGSKKRRHPPGFIGFRGSRPAQLLTEDAQRVGHGAVLLGQGRAEGLGVDMGLFPAAVERKGAGSRGAERRRVDAPGQLPGQVVWFQMALLFQNGAEGLHPLQRGGILLFPAGFAPPAVGA